MRLDALSPDNLFYLATPYTHYPLGLHAAFRDACALAAHCIRAGIKVYSPIAHGHPVMVHGGLDPLDHAMWLAFDEAMMSRSDCLIVAKLPGWHESKGIAHEIAFFERYAKPIWSIDPDTLEIEPGVQ